MKFAALSLVGLLVIGTNALPASVSHTLHEKRSSTSSWSKNPVIKPDGRINLPVRIGLKEKNLDQGYELLMGVSDPKSPNYSNHWTPKEASFRDTDSPFYF